MSNGLAKPNVGVPEELHGAPAHRHVNDGESVLRDIHERPRTTTTTPQAREDPLVSSRPRREQVVSPQDDVTEKAISRAIGEELRRAREANGWSRRYLVTRLPSGIGDRTLLSYEYGTRHLTLLRFIELCRALGVAAPTLLNQALQRARIHLQNLVLQIDLHQLLNDRNDTFLPMVQWAHNKLIECPAGIVELPPSSVRELATFLGCPSHELGAYLATFIPEYHADPSHTLGLFQDRWGLDVSKSEHHAVGTAPDGKQLSDGATAPQRARPPSHGLSDDACGRRSSGSR
jgi:transcriptional regulator with XRE-family HTH domain